MEVSVIIGWSPLIVKVDVTYVIQEFPSVDWEWSFTDKSIAMMALRDKRYAHPTKHYVLIKRTEQVLLDSEMPS